MVNMQDGIRILKTRTTRKPPGKVAARETAMPMERARVMVNRRSEAEPRADAIIVKKKFCPGVFWLTFVGAINSCLSYLHFLNFILFLYCTEVSATPWNGWGLIHGRWSSCSSLIKGLLKWTGKQAPALHHPQKACRSSGKPDSFWLFLFYLLP